MNSLRAVTGRFRRWVLAAARCGSGARGSWRCCSWCRWRTGSSRRRTWTRTALGARTGDGATVACHMLIIIMSCHAMSCHAMSFTASSEVCSHPVASCHFMCSYPVMSCHVCVFISCRAMAWRDLTARGSRTPWVARRTAGGGVVSLPAALFIRDRSYTIYPILYRIL